MLLTLLNIIIPVFAVAGAGYWFARRLPQGGDMGFINGANVQLFCPALIFSAMAMHPLNLDSSWQLVVAGIAIVLLPGLLLWPLARRSGMQGPAFLMTAMFRNTGNMGIPLMMLAYGRELLGDIIVLFVLANTLHFSVGLWLISRSRGSLAWLKSPNIWAAVLGLLLAPHREHIPGFILTTAEMLAQVSIPLMLFGLGVRMAQSNISGVALALRINLMYLAAGLAAAALTIWALGLQGDWARMLWLYAALPPAVLNYLLSEQYRADSHTVANVVLLGNLLAVVVMPVVVFLTLL